MGLKSDTISAFAWKLFERSGKIAVELIIQILLARLLAPKEFGAMAIMLVFINIGNVLVQSGMTVSLVQAPKVTDEDYSTAFWLNLAVSLLVYLIIFFSAPALADLVNAENAAPAMRLLGVVVIVASLSSVPVAICQRSLRYRSVFFGSFVSVVIAGVAGVSVAFVGGGLWALVIQQVTYHTVFCCLIFIQVSWKPLLVARAQSGRRLFSFSWKILVSGLLDQGYQSLSDLIIASRYSASTLGIVSQGKKYPQAIGSTLDGAIQPVMLSAVARLQEDTGKVRVLVRRALKTSTFLVFPTMTLVGVSADSLIAVLLGDRWMFSVPFFRMYCFVYMLLPVHSTNLQALNGLGRSDIFLRLEVIKKCYGFACLLAVVLLGGGVTMLVGSYMVMGIVSTFVNSYPTKKIVNYSYAEQLRDIMPATFLSVVAGAGAWMVGYVPFDRWIVIVIQFMTGFTIYVCLAKAFRVETFNYISELRPRSFRSHMRKGDTK